MDQHSAGNSDSATCLVTGGAGFIGSTLAERLVERFRRVVLVDNLHPQVHPGSKPPRWMSPRAELVVGDVSDPRMWDALLAGCSPSLVFHLAAETGTGQSLSESSRHARVNVVGTTEMLDAFSRHHAAPRRIVLASSRAVYGEGQWIHSDSKVPFYPGQRSQEQLQSAAWDFTGSEPQPHRATDVEPRPCSIYAATKLAQEHLIRSWSMAHNVESVILRLQNVFGPRQSLTNPYTGIVSLFLQKAMARSAIPLYEDGLPTRDFIFISDVADAFCRAIDAPQNADPIDIGSGNPTSLLELATIISDITSGSGSQVTGLFRPGDVRHAVCDNSEAKRILGWTPQWRLRDALITLRDWILEEKLNATG